MTTQIKFIAHNQYDDFEKQINSFLETWIKLQGIKYNITSDYKLENYYYSALIIYTKDISSNDKPKVIKNYDKIIESRDILKDKIKLQSY